MKNKLKIGWWGIIVSGVAVGVLVLLWIFVVGVYLNKPGSFFNKGHNAVWIGHEWVGQNKTDAQIQELVGNLKKYQIDTVFVHVGPLNQDGTIDPGTYKYSLNFIEKAKKFESDIDYQAWLGQVRNKIDLSSKDVRHNVANQALIMGQMVGFDGIHFDIEPVWDDDKDFILLLKETRDVLPKDKIISVALAEFIPNSFVWMIEKVYKFKNYNSQINYKNVAEYANQIVAMAYDTGLKSERLYKWLVKEQTIWLTDLLDGKEVFIGIPAYDDQNVGFDPQVENIENGLRGIIAGLNNIRSNDENFAGVAIYPYWEMDESEWGSYENLWLK